MSIQFIIPQLDRRNEPYGGKIWNQFKQSVVKQFGTCYVSNIENFYLDPTGLITSSPDYLFTLPSDSAGARALDFVFLPFLTNVCKMLNLDAIRYHIGTGDYDGFQRFTHLEDS